jgi:hypothetical protein
MLRALGAAPSSDSAAYADVAQTDWYAGYVAAASEYGLVDGYDENRFGPQEKLTREQAMTSIARAMKLTGLEPALTGDNAQALLEGYADRTSISAYARESIAVCLQVRVAEGRTATAIDPASHITRAETTALVYRLLQKSELIGE